MKFQGDVGRLKYSTKAKAKKASRKLGLNGRTHSHKFEDMNGGRRFYMPGSQHRELSNALMERGLPPAPPRGSGGGMGGGMSSGMGGGMNDGMGKSDGGKGMFGGSSSDDAADEVEKLLGQKGGGPDKDSPIGFGLGLEELAGDEDDDGEMELY